MVKLPVLKFSPSNGDRALTWPSHPHARYWFSACTVIITLLLIGLGEIVFGSLPLVLFAAAIVTASKFACIGGGIISVVLSKLACDFFFLSPVFALNFDLATWTLAAKYAAIAVLSYAMFRHRWFGIVQTANPVLPGSGYLDGVIEGELFGWASTPIIRPSPRK